MEREERRLNGNDWKMDDMCKAMLTHLDPIFKSNLSNTEFRGYNI